MIDTTKGFTLTREIDATPEELWTAWTDPDELAHWWHPRGVTTPRDSVTVDLRVGGAYTYTMVNDSTGDEYPTGGVYREIVPTERLVFTWGNPDDDPDDAPVVTVTFESLGELTLMTFQLQGVDGTPGDESFYDGWVSALDVLVEHAQGPHVFG
ncbi:SRPBCC family protein [Cellulomonas rhizosphaerae]|uniref:SRPBCC domain-containing protein n=1 Tax=Cellulomonas rhizosphaerae TaxID=2293719 RepID=A0A413RLR8_9CELL|nr:SRPBCC domain-containing protein [Cellulomonas rhizosphaerae]RHA41001.1 SRPBCC domain-containing protein [Cellulomonas rhizosphaerae]